MTATSTSPPMTEQGPRDHIATPERELDLLRAAQAQDRERLDTIRDRIKRRARAITDLAARVTLNGRLKKHGVRRAWTVLAEADRASRAADVPRDEFRAMALVCLAKETGLPQHNIFGGDHGNVGDTPPFYHQEVNHYRGTLFIAALRRDPWPYMNGVSWTQTTWYEKVYRVAAISPDLTDPAAHMRVCFGDLAVLRRAYGVRDAFRRYNGAGTAAELYAADAMSRLPIFQNLVNPSR